MGDDFYPFYFRRLARGPMRGEDKENDQSPEEEKKGIIDVILHLLPPFIDGRQCPKNGAFP